MRCLSTAGAQADSYLHLKIVLLAVKNHSSTKRKPGHTLQNRITETTFKPQNMGYSCTYNNQKLQK
jgi:hypothetical protein